MSTKIIVFWVLSGDADTFVEQIRPAFIAYQIPLGLGVTQVLISALKRNT
ncbi:hypothetical protein JFV29_01210 [Peribacillus sp. TH16]|nr:hypothetical protein [Peribacillus sp. TH16]MBK5480575.1 hypothetical protein [Peribacillus sp. TH16]